MAELLNSFFASVVTVAKQSACIALYYRGTYGLFLGYRCRVKL